MKNVFINNKSVGDGFPCFIVGEIGGAFKNFEEAKRLIDSAIEIGLDAVKFQTLEADTITTKNNYFDMKATGKISQYEFFKLCEISKDLQLKIVKYAKDCGIEIFTAPSHLRDLEIMKKMDLSFYKIGSDLACHIPLLKEIATLGKPIILSTGMCTLEEVKQSVNTVLSTGNDQLILLHCVSDYPTKIDEANLNSIITLKKEFDFPVGFSDHVEGTLADLVAVAMGANMIEKHFHDVRNSPNADDIISLEKNEFSILVKNIRNIEKAKGSGKKKPTKSEQQNMLTNRVSIIAIKDIPSNNMISKDMIDIRRPGTGIQPFYFDDILGKKTKKNIVKDEPLTWEMLYK